MQSAQLVRVSLEISIAKLAAEKMDALGELTLRQAIEKQRLTSQHSAIARFYGSDERLHRAISEIAGLPLVWSHIEEAKLQMDRVRHLNLINSHPFNELIQQHVKIVDAITQNNSAEIDATLTNHLGKILPDLESIRLNRPEFFAS